MRNKYFKLLLTVVLMIIFILILSACEQLAGNKDDKVYNVTVKVSGVENIEDINGLFIKYGDSIVPFKSENYDVEKKN
ncbi:MAG: hypothetical protein ACOCRZ_06940 [Halothermotrichaceae bacterium]